MRKKWLKMLFLPCLTVTLFAAFTACGDKDGDNGNTDSPPAEKPPVEEVLDPVVAAVKDVTADITDRPEGFPIGEYELTSVTKDGEPFEDYVTRNGYFLFAYDLYGDGFAVGEYEFSLALEGYEGNSEFTLTVEDGKPPKYEMPVEGIPYSVTKSDVELPLVERDNPYQTYVTEYSIFDGEELLTTAEDVEKGENSLDTSLLEIGKSYTYAVRIVHKDEEIENKTYPFTVKESENFLSEENYGKFSYNKNYLDVSFDEDLNAARILKKEKNQGIESCFLLPFGEILEKKNAGYDKLTFWYYTEKSSLFAGQCFESIVGTVFTSTPGGGFMPSFNTEEGVWTELSVNLHAFSYTDETTWFSLQIFNDKGTEVILKDMYFERADVSEPTSEQNVSLWSGVNTAVAYDETEQAMKLTRAVSNNDDGRGVETMLTSKNNTVYYPKSYVDKALQANPNVYALKVSYKGSKAFVESSVNAFKIWASTVWNTSLNGGQSVTYVTEKWQTTYLPLSAFDSANADWQYLVFALGGVQGSEIFFKIEYATESEYETYLKESWAKNLLTRNGLSHWTVYSPKDGISVGGTDSSLAVTMMSNGAINGRWYAASFAVDMLKELSAEGYTKMSFTVSYNGETGSGVGLRVYDHTHADKVLQAGVQNGSDGVTAAQDFLIQEKDKAQTVTIDLATYLNTNDPRIGIVFSGAKGCVFTLENLSFSK